MILQEGPTPRWGEEEGQRPYSLSKPLKPQLANYSPTISIFENQQKLDFSTVNRQQEATLAKKATIFRRVFCQPMNDFIDFSHCEPYHVSPQRPYSLHIRSVAHALPRSVTKPGNKNDRSHRNGHATGNYQLVEKLLQEKCRKISWTEMILQTCLRVNGPAAFLYDGLPFSVVRYS